MISFEFPRLITRFLQRLSWPVVIVGCLVSLSVVELSAESLGKGPAYFYDRYGAPASNRAIVGHKVYIPFKYAMVPIDEPCLYRRYRKGDLSVDVLFSDPGLKALCVRISLPRKFTDKSMAAALDAYGSGWKRLTTDKGLGVEIPYLHMKRLYRSEEGFLAFFSPIGSQLHIYSTDVFSTAKAFEHAEDERLEAVPTF